MKVSLAALKGDKTMSELAAQFDVQPNQIRQWKDQLLEGTTGVFNVRALPLVCSVTNLPVLS